MSAEGEYATWTPDAIGRQIESDEDSELETKEALSWKGQGVESSADGVADSLVAGANSTGGSLVFSVSDSGEVKALSRRQIDVPEAYVSTVCEDRIVPPLMCRTRRLALSHWRADPIVVVAGSTDVRWCPRGYVTRQGSTVRNLAFAHLQAPIGPGVGSACTEPTRGGCTCR